ncbi:MAG: MATE family efflux transporter [Oscillospiraceae bacterium]|nr:MATE family efflux transporter [Oscillospiraceae bacterium]
MNEAIKNNPLGSEKVSKLMVKFSVPSIIAMLVGALYNIVDQLFIGQAVGTLGNAATNVAFPLSTSCISLALLFGIGGASCFNLTMGRGDRKSAPYFVGNSVVMLALSGVFLCAVTEIFLTPLLVLFGSPDDVMPYAQEYVRITAVGFPFLIITTGGCHLIRADGSPGMSMFCNIIGAVVNTVLDAWFVMVLDWGMAGAAYATVIGQVISTAIVIVYLFRFKTVPLTKEHFSIKAVYLKKIVSIGAASFFNQIAMMIVQIVVNNSLKHYGALSEYGASIPLAASGIVMKVNQIMFAIVIGLGQGTQPIESFNYGAKQYKRVREAYRLAIITGTAISLVAFAAFQIFPREIMSLFGEGTESYFEFGIKFFRIFLLFTWINGVQPITTTFFTSIGKPIKGTFLSLTRQIIFFLPLMVILPLFYGIDGIIYTGPVADFLSAAVTLGMVAFEFRAMKKLELEDTKV